MAVIFKTEDEIKIMAEGGKKLAQILKILEKEVKPGKELKFFDQFSRELIKKAGAEPVFLNYRPSGAGKPYPAAICVSVNETIVHGLPSRYVIQNGDIVKLDLGLRYKGFCVDAALTVGAGFVNEEKKKLISTAEKAMYAGIEEIKNGKTLGDIGFAIEKEVKEKGFSVADSLCGHGIGRELHEDPYVLNYGRRGEGYKLRPGLVLAIEPMVVAGNSEIKQLGDDSFVSADGSLSSHFEHTVALTKNGPRILTKL